MMPTAVVVTAAPAGSGLPTLTLTASGTNGNLTTIGCASLQIAARPNVATTARPIGIIMP